MCNVFGVDVLTMPTYLVAKNMEFWGIIHVISHNFVVFSQQYNLLIGKQIS